jgi:mono/diheme cytochrome c family protein
VRNTARAFLLLLTAIGGLAAAEPLRSQHQQADDSPAFTQDIAPIILDHCSACHQPGQAAPFSLLTFDDVHKRAKQIAIVTLNRFMPPWQPEPNQPPAHFAGERRLTNEQIAMIQRWVDHGAPQGEPDSDPRQVRAPAPGEQDNGWALGKPDFILSLDEPFQLAAEGLDVVHTFVFPVNQSEDQFIKAIDFRCSNPQAVHHVSFLLDETGNARMLDEADPGPGYASMGDLGLNLAGSYGVWSVGSHADLSRDAREGSSQMFLPKGVARPLPNEAALVAEAHFKPTGKPEALKVEAGVHLAREPVHRFPIAIALGTFFIDIPAGERFYQVKDSVTLTVDAHLLSVAPRAHYVCRTMNVSAILPDGSLMQLLRIDDWDFNWQQEYVYATPPCLPAGTKIEMEFTYDNSAENPRNPTIPPQRVRDGYRPTDEMGLLFLHAVADQRSDHEKLEQGKSAKLITMMEMARTRRSQEKEGIDLGTQ